MTPPSKQSKNVAPEYNLENSTTDDAGGDGGAGGDGAGGGDGGAGAMILDHRT